MNISAASRLVTVKFYQKHHWGGGKPALGLGPDRIRTLVSIAIDSSHMLIMGETVLSRFLSCFDRILFILAGNDDIHKSLDEFKIRPDPTPDQRASKIDVATFFLDLFHTNAAITLRTTVGR